MFVITIYNGGIPTVIHEPGSSAVKVDSAKVSKEANAFDSLTFDIYPDNPGWEIIKPFATTVEAVRVDTGEKVFEGRAIQPVPSMESDGNVYKSVTCEGLMGYLCDSMQKYVQEQHFADEGETTGLQHFIDLLLERHNAAVEAHKRIYRGNVALQTFDTSGGVTKAVERKSTWDNLNDKLLDSFGGEMRVRRGDDGLLYLDYAEKLGTTRATKIELRRNLVEQSSETDPTNVITRLYPYGSKISITETDEGGNTQEVETEERITIESVNPTAYIDDTVAMEEYGIIEGVMEWDDVTTFVFVLSKAKDWLGKNNAMPVSHSLTALDLSLLGLDVDDFRLFDSYPCRNPVTGLEEELEIVKRTIDLNEPENSTFEMGETSYRLSGEIGRPSWVEEEIKDFQSQTNTNINNVNNSIVATATSIKLTLDSIISQVQETTTTVNGSITEIKQQITEMVQNPEGWIFEFTEINEQLGDLETAYSEQLKYFKFIDGEIWIGRDPDPGQDDFKCVISNEKIRFMQNNVEIAYLSNNQLYVTNAEVLNTLIIGAFGWYPRENGNMTLRLRG